MFDPYNLDYLITLPKPHSLGVNIAAALDPRFGGPVLAPLLTSFSERMCPEVSTPTHANFSTHAAMGKPQSLVENRVDHSSTVCTCDWVCEPTYMYSL